MIKLRKVLAVFACTAALAPAHAGLLTQEFVSEWTVSTWDYYGDVAALQWHYIPYLAWDPALGTLEKVSVSTAVSGNKNVFEDLAIRYSFFTGWSSAAYQFYDAKVFAAGAGSFADLFEYDIAASNFVAPLYLPQANYYFESRSATTHQIAARTTLSYQYAYPTEVAVPEPSTVVLAAIGACAFFLGRKSWARHSGVG
ncbi:PEP-CTERM sorting domain-containing protein [Massilia sp. CMS3.1]|uniref:PEP-CTERM sorting domain-containing protein n=1 Tax=Massilia sp. CMS3.1 TaxID=3373083 RepID=UPI003EE6E0DD